MPSKLEILINAKDKASGTLAKVGGALPGLGTAFAAVGAASTAAAASIFAITKATAAAHDKMGKFASRIGISTEALSAYHHVAVMSGVTVETINMGFQRMTRRISEASRGTGVAVKALGELGISIDSIHGKAPDQQFEMIAAALDGVANQSDKARLAMQFFDSEGVALLQTLTSGTKGLQEMKDEAEKFGLVVSQRAAANSAAFNDSLSRLTGSFKGLRNHMAEEVMPTITGLSNRFAYFVANNRDGILDFAEKATVALSGFIEYSSYGVALLIDSWRGLQMVWQVLKGGLYELTAFMNEALSALAFKFRETLEAMNIKGVFDTAIAEIKAFEDGNKEAVESLRAMSEQAFTDLREITDQGMAVEKVKDFASKVKSTIAEIRAEGDAGSMLGIDDETREQTLTNVQAMTDAQVSSYNQLLAAHDQYYLSEEERLAVWYEKQQEMYTGHQEALLVLDDVYHARKKEIEAARQEEIEAQRQAQIKKNEKYNQDELKRQAKGDSEKAKMASDREKIIFNLQKQFGQKGFNLSKLINIKEAYANTKAAAMSAYKAMAGIPVIGPALGVAAAAAAIAYGAQQVLDIKGQSLGGAAHGGLSFVPREQTYLLDRGERVLSPDQNRDFTDALQGGGIGGGMTIENFALQVMPNATNPEALLAMTTDDWESIAMEKMLPAFRELSLRGQTI